MLYLSFQQIILCFFALMYNDLRTAIMRVCESHFRTILLRRSQEIAARIAIRIIFWPNIYWLTGSSDISTKYYHARPTIVPSREFIEYFRCFPRWTLPVYLPRDRKFPSWRTFPFYICFAIDSQWQRSMFSQCFQFFPVHILSIVQIPSINFFYFYFYLVRFNPWTLSSNDVSQFIYYTYFCIFF